MFAVTYRKLFWCNSHFTTKKRFKRCDNCKKKIQPVEDVCKLLTPLNINLFMKIRVAMFIIPKKFLPRIHMHYCYNAIVSAIWQILLASYFCDEDMLTETLHLKVENI